MMSKFVWTDDLNIGHDAVDADHQQLFELANRVHQSDSQSSVTECALELFHLIHQHFQDEELLMQQLQYPEYESHLEAHEEMLLSMEEIAKHLTAAGPARQALNRLLVDWLQDHIIKEDMQVGEFARRHSF